MGLFDILNAGKIKKENENLKELLTPEMQKAVNLKEHIEMLQQQAHELEKKKERLQQEYDSCSKSVEDKKKELIIWEDALTFQDFGLYTPRYTFTTSDEYKKRLDKIRLEQKDLIKNDKAITASENWTLDGSKVKGKAMIKSMKKLFLRAFNADCEDVISKVKYNNLDMSLKKIEKSADAIEKLGKSMSLRITIQYMNLKVDELYLAFEYQQKKQEEKEEQKAIRAEMREAAKLQKEIDEQRRRTEKEQSHYLTAYNKLKKQLESDPDNEELIKKSNELGAQLEIIEKSLKDIDYREANQKAGYVYIISNIGAFGENVYKIGMTRRLNPQDRIDELSSASVPFNFDVHAMIFSDNAPALEAALHRAFDNKKLNLVNTRREFFKVTLDEIKKVVKENFDKTVEFVDYPDAEQYRISQKMKEGIQNETI